MGSATKSKKKSKPSSSQSEGAARAAKATAIPPMVLVGKAQAKLPALSEKEAAVFDARPSDAACKRLGANTKAKGVLDEASRWVPALLQQIQRKLKVLKYGEKRLAHFCASLVALNAAIEAADSALSGKQGARGGAVAARAAAQATHDELLAKLESIADGDDDDEGAVAAARATSATDSDLVRALGRLAVVAATFLDRAKKDETYATLADEAHLEGGDVTSARARAAALSEATATHTEAGAARGNDPPAVNRAEGRVIACARRAYAATADANKKDGTVPRLTPGPQLARVLGAHTTRKAKPATTGAPAPSATAKQPTG